MWTITATLGVVATAWSLYRFVYLPLRLRHWLMITRVDLAVPIYLRLTRWEQDYWMGNIVTIAMGKQDKKEKNWHLLAISLTEFVETIERIQEKVYGRDNVRDMMAHSLNVESLTMGFNSWLFTIAKMRRWDLLDERTYGVVTSGKWCSHLTRASDGWSYVVNFLRWHLETPQMKSMLQPRDYAQSLMPALAEMRIHAPKHWEATRKILAENAQVLLIEALHEEKIPPELLPTLEKVFDEKHVSFGPEARLRVLVAIKQWTKIAALLPDLNDELRGAYVRALYDNNALDLKEIVKPTSSR